jgi:hypothetical protein
VAAYSSSGPKTTTASAVEESDLRDGPPALPCPRRGTMRGSVNSLRLAVCDAMTVEVRQSRGAPIVVPNLAPGN